MTAFDSDISSSVYCSLVRILFPASYDVSTFDRWLRGVRNLSSIRFAGCRVVCTTTATTSAAVDRKEDQLIQTMVIEFITSWKIYPSILK
uniref:Lipocalin/cytosolic fatty-acid binding domain-containing protein n=1 Tax=Parascaris univalens TaxID=6257 RepID=A0A915AZN5_PARUN